MAEYVPVFASAARTATTSSPDRANHSGTGMVCVIDCTADPASASVVFTIEGKDPASNKYYTILASAAITGTGTTVLRVHPDLTAAANTIAKDMVPAVWRVTATAGNSDSLTYSVGVSLI